jgi:signal transduction histidine kinase
MGPDWLTRIAGARHAPELGVGVLALAAAAEAIARAAASSSAGSPGSVLFCLLALASTVSLIFLRPVAAAVAITAANVLAITAFGATTVAGGAALLISVYRLAGARRAGGYGAKGAWGDGQSPQAGGLRGVGPRELTQYLAIGLTLPFLVLALFSNGRVGPVFLAALVPAAAATGLALRARRDADVQTVASEVLTDTLTQHMARGERARIARELHDVVAHHISVIAVQAETARLTTPGLSPVGTQRFTEIGDTARAGLTEMRRLLGVLREDADATVPDRHPQPGLPQLAGLIDSARDASGAGTRLIVSGPVAEFDPGVELAAYRIVQEALTNARRHAPGAAVDVELRYSDDGLRLRIRDNGPGPPAAGYGDRGGPDADASGRTGGAHVAGHGLLGMRERALAVGGSLRTGAAPGGGFCVEAVLPAKPDTAMSRAEGNR